MSECHRQRERKSKVGHGQRERERTAKNRKALMIFRYKTEIEIVCPILDHG